MEKSYPILYNQNDYPQRLGTAKSTVTIAQGGCFVTSFAMKASLYGHQVNPVQLNDLLVQKGSFIAENLLADNALAQVYSDVHYVKTLDYEPVPTDLNAIKGLLDDKNTTLTVRINLGSGNLHFVEAVACDGYALHIANPLSGKVEDFTQRYGNPVTAKLHVLVYNGPVTDPQPAAVSPVTQRFNEAINKSNNFDTVCKFFGIPNDQAVQLGTGAQLVLDKVTYLQKEIDTLQGDKEKLQQSLNEATAALTAVKSVPASPVVDPVSSAVPAVPQTPPVAPQQQPTFTDGSLPIPSTSTPSVATTTPASQSATIASGQVNVIEFFRALFNVLFK